MAQYVKSLPVVRESHVRSLTWEDPLEKEMATHSSTLAWRIPMDREAWRATVHGVTKSWTLEDQPWDFFARNDVRAETPVLFATSCEELLIGKKL